jgi:hypothetical protein
LAADPFDKLRAGSTGLDELLGGTFYDSQLLNRRPHVVLTDEAKLERANLDKPGNECPILALMAKDGAFDGSFGGRRLA